MTENILQMKKTKQSQTVSLSVEEGGGIISIDNPPVNAGSHSVRSGIVSALNALKNMPVQGAVVIGVGRGFSGGSDVKEFGAKLQSPEVPDVIRALEDSPFPVVAAIHGMALGGGLELALGCDYRIADQKAFLALPEVQLGMIPGAGGTQRLPRLTGIKAALEMICSGDRIPADKAFELGFIDQVCQGDLLECAKRFIDQKAPLNKRIAIEQAVPQEPVQLIEGTVAKILKRHKGRKNIVEAIRLVQDSKKENYADALKDERQTFNDLRMGDDAFALRHLFFAEKKAPQIEGLDKAQQTEITSVGIIGGGTMGQGIAKAVLNAGLPVVLVERDGEACAKAVESISESYQILVKKGILEQGEADVLKSRIASTPQLSALKDCQLVIEAVFEDMAVKKQLLCDLEECLSEQTVLATNTSYLDINEMVEGLKQPERVLGLHFFSPADRMKLLEIVRAEKTSDGALATGLSFGKKLGKQIVVSAVSEGFIGNRIYAAYRRCAELLVLDGASPYEIDKALKAFGFAMGPFEVSDLSGLDIAWAMRKRKAADRDPKERYVTIADQLCEAGMFGRKTGQGWYHYEKGQAGPSPVVAEIIEQTRKAENITPRSFDEQTIQQQLLLAMVNEAACLIEEGVSQRAADVDVVLTNGYGFPRWRGGPLYWASQQGQGDVNNALSDLAAMVGHGFKAGPVEKILKNYAERPTENSHA